MTRLAAVVALVLVVGSACGKGSPAVHASGILVTPGRVGPLQIDHSTQADVLAFAGRRGSLLIFGQEPWPGVPKYRAYGYGCPGPQTPGSLFPTVLGCRTVYYINARTHRLVAFYTESSHFHTANGIRPGMDQDAADWIAHQTPQGPWLAIGQSSSIASLILPSSCRKLISGRRTGKVKDFMLESRHHPIGLLFT